MDPVTNNGASREASGTALPCPICAYADVHASWPPEHRGTHCSTCHRSWTSTAQAHCTVCCAHFTADSVAEKHWLRTQHQDPATVKGLYFGSDGVWSTSPDRNPAALAARLAASRQLSFAVAS